MKYDQELIEFVQKYGTPPDPNKVFDITCAHKGLTHLPENIGKLIRLTSIRCEENELTSLPESIGNLIYLKQLNCSWNFLSSLPESIGNLTSLNELYCYENKLVTFPRSIGNLKSLERLYCCGNKLKYFPESMGKLTLSIFHYIGTDFLVYAPRSFYPLLSNEIQDRIDINRDLLKEKYAEFQIIFSKTKLPPEVVEKIFALKEELPYELILKLVINNDY